MKISELKVKKKIHRPTRNFDAEGKRIYEEFEYIFTYNASYKGNERDRIVAKLIDMLPFFITFLLIFSQNGFIALGYSIVGVILWGTITETLWGTTLGKKIFNIKVIDDQGHYPKILKSFVRNIVCLGTFKLLFNDYIPPLNEILKTEHQEANFTMHMNNKLCRTYIVKENKVAEIRKLLEGEQQ